MALTYSRLWSALPIALFCILQFPAVGSAQQIDPNGMPYEPEGCPRLAALFPLPSAKVVSCQDSNSVEVSMPLKPDANGVWREKKVRGAYQFREYQIGSMEQPYAFDHLLEALPTTGFKVKYSMKPATITGRNGDTWILINVADESYNVTVVREAPLEYATVKTAEGISREMEAHKRVDIYGIEFSPADQSVLESRSPILFEVLKYLKHSPEVSIIIESDKISPIGPPEQDLEITRERANAVTDWLVAHGIAQSRVQPRPAGRNNPLTENESPSEIQRNERIVLIKSQT